MNMGVWGSAAMELHTGYLYTHDGSDLDFFLQPKSKVSVRTLTRCLDAIVQSEQNFHVRVDVELSLPSGYGISLKELMDGKGTSVLGKGLHDVVLLRKSMVFDCLSAYSANVASTVLAAHCDLKGPVSAQCTPAG